MHPLPQQSWKHSTITAIPSCPMNATGNNSIPSVLPETALVFNASNTPAEREQAILGGPWKNCISGFCGRHHVKRKTFRIGQTARRRTAMNGCRKSGKRSQNTSRRTALPIPQSQKARPEKGNVRKKATPGKTACKQGKVAPSSSCLSCYPFDVHSVKQRHVQSSNHTCYCLPLPGRLRN